MILWYILIGYYNDFMVYRLILTPLIFKKNYLVESSHTVFIS